MVNNTKKTLILLGVAVILVIVFLIWQTPFNSSQNSSQETIFTADLNKASKIEITHGETTIILTKLDSIWVIESEENAKANQFLIDNIIEATKISKNGTLISQNKEKFANFMLTDEDARKLKIYDNNNNLIINLLIGKTNTAGLDQNYIRLTDNDKIYLVATNFVRTLNQPNWKEPPPVELDTENIGIEPVE